jgi:hypothetical protein
MYAIYFTTLTYLLPKVEERDMHSLAYFGFVKKKQAVVLREVL